jgi:hypothetical protein
MEIQNWKIEIRKPKRDAGQIRAENQRRFPAASFGLQGPMLKSRRRTGQKAMSYEVRVSIFEFPVSSFDSLTV